MKHKIKTAFGSDMLFSAALTPRQGAMLTHLDPLVLERRDPEDGDIGQW